MFSLRSKKARVSNVWKVDYYSENDVDKTQQYNNLYQQNQLVIEKSGAYLIHYLYQGNLDYTESGNWKFNDNKTAIIFYRTTPGTDTSDLRILRLKENELWLLDGDSVRKEYRLVPF